jgi:hypothetical protein
MTRPLLLAVPVALAACAPSAASTRPAPAATRVTLPAALEGQRSTYEAEVAGALEDVATWFTREELPLPSGPIVKEVVVLGGAEEARKAVAKRAGVAEDQIPDGFSGTVDGDTLLLVDHGGYEAIFRRLYPDEAFGEGEYRRLAAHEVAHRAHELVVIARTGSSDAMGPRWFFEGLALACAGQFAASSPGKLSPPEVGALIAKDAEHPLGYPRYAELFRSVARRTPVKELVARAGSADFAAAVAR